MAIYVSITRWSNMRGVPPTTNVRSFPAPCEKAPLHSLRSHMTFHPLLMPEPETRLSFATHPFLNQRPIGPAGSDIKRTIAPPDLLIEFCFCRLSLMNKFRTVPGRTGCIGLTCSSFESCFEGRIAVLRYVVF